VVVLEAAEAARDHAVLKKARAVPGLGHDERDVIVGKAELQAFPAHGFAGRDKAAGAAIDGIHAELAFYDIKMCGKREATLNRCMDVETVP